MSWRRSRSRSTSWVPSSKKRSRVTGPSRKKDAFESLTEDFHVGLRTTIAGITSESDMNTKLFPEVLSIISGLLGSEDYLTLRQISRSWKATVDRYLISKEEKGFIEFSKMPCVYLQNQEKVEAFQKSMARYRNSRLGPIPFEIRVGIGMFPGDLFNIQEEWDKLFVKLYWDAVYKMVVQLGTRICGICFDIRVRDGLGFSLAERTVKIVMSSLKQLHNLEFLIIRTNTIRVESLLSSYYKMHQNKGRYHSLKTLPFLAKLKTLEIVTFGGNCSGVLDLTSTKPCSFPWRFLLQHGSTLKKLRIFGHLKELKTMGLLKAPNLETVSFEVHHCPRGKGEENSLAELPRIEVGKDTLKDVEVSLNWNWRACDVAGILKWLGSNFSGEKGYALEELNLKTCMPKGIVDDDEEEDEDEEDEDEEDEDEEDEDEEDEDEEDEDEDDGDEDEDDSGPLFSLSDNDNYAVFDMPDLYWEEDEELDFYDKMQRDIEKKIDFINFWNPGIGGHYGEHEERECLGPAVLLPILQLLKKRFKLKGEEKISKQKAPDGENVTFSSWIETLKLPKVKSINMLCKYKDSLRWLSAFPNDSLKHIVLYYKLKNPKLAYQKGFLEDFLKDHGIKEDDEKKEIKDGLIWNFFPKLDSLVLMWLDCPEEPCVWYICRTYFEDYLKEQKEGKKMKEEGKVGGEEKKINIYNQKEQLLKIIRPKK